MLTVFVVFFDLDLKLEDLLIAFGCDSSECNITSSIHSTGIISSLSVITAGISFKSASLSKGMITFFMPPRFAASNYSFKPPIFNTWPLKVISPVIATSDLTGISVKADINAVVIPTPALGPSFGVAPSGT